MAADTTQTRTPAVLRQDRFVQRKQIYCISEEKNRTNLLAYIRMCVCVYACMHIFVCACICLHICTVYMHMMYIYYIYIYIYVPIYVLKYKWLANLEIVMCFFTFPEII